MKFKAKGTPSSVRVPKTSLHELAQEICKSTQTGISLSLVSSCFGKTIGPRSELSKAGVGNLWPLGYIQPTKRLDLAHKVLIQSMFH